MNVELVAEIAREGARLVGLDVAVVPLEGVRLRIGEPEQARHALPPEGAGGPPDEVDAHGVLLEDTYALLQPAGVRYAAFRRGPAGTFHRCVAPDKLRRVLAFILMRVVWDRLRDRGDLLAPLLVRLGPSPAPAPAKPPARPPAEAKPDPKPRAKAGPAVVPVPGAPAPLAGRARAAKAKKSP